MVEKILLIEMDDVFRKPDHDPQNKTRDRNKYCSVTLGFNWDYTGYELLKWYKSQDYTIIGVNCHNDWRKEYLSYSDRHQFEYQTLVAFKELSAIAFYTPLHGVYYHYQTREAKFSMSAKCLPRLQKRFPQVGICLPDSTAVLAIAISYLIGKFATLEAFDITVIGKISTDLYRDAERLGIKFLDVETVKGHVNALSKKKVHQ